MSWSKRQIISKAFAKIGLASYKFDLNPGEFQDALTDLEAMIGTWQSENITFGYPMTADPENADLDTETNAPRALNETIFLNLAVKLAPGFGKSVSPDLKSDAKRLYDYAYGQYNKPKTTRRRGLPTGQGNNYSLGNSRGRTLPQEEDTTIDKPSTTIGFP